MRVRSAATVVVALLGFATLPGGSGSAPALGLAWDEAAVARHAL